ncbi:MAG: hypothetical protein KDN19_14525 [Verrucomicrobiae bacterium]|nr:hypothetical protein [Verrucomicrobiae bacterium]
MSRSVIFIGRGLVCLGILFFPATAGSWGIGHRVITAAAIEVMPAELRKRWRAVHRHPVSGEEMSIANWLVQRYCHHPDWVDGPSRADGSDIPERKRATQFVYAEKNGQFFPPIAWADPDRDPKATRPKTYHYFTFPQEEVNRALAERGARWYFERISKAFAEGNDVAAAEYSGAFAHAIQDRVSPFHVWDGYTAEREALETGLAAEGLQSPEGSRNGKPANASLFWGLDGPHMKADLKGYAPKLLGESVEAAAKAFTDRLFENREFAKTVYTNRGGFLAAHLADDWKNKQGSEATDVPLSIVARHNAELTADVFYTAWVFSENR